MSKWVSIYMFALSLKLTTGMALYCLAKKIKIKARIFNLLKTKTKNQNSTKPVFLEFVDGRYKGDRLEIILCNTLREVFKI